MVVVAFAVVFLTYGYQASWTGFGEISRRKDASTDVQHAKTLWDWLQLCVIPAVLAIVGFLLNRGEKRRDQSLAEMRTAADRELATDRNREASLQTYLTEITNLLLSGRLRAVTGDIKPESAEEDTIRANLAVRVRTLTILPTLDPQRRASVLRFLAELHLIDDHHSIIPLDDADFRGVAAEGFNLQGVNLSHVLLDGANLSASNLRHAYLAGASIQYVNLSDACIESASLVNAKLQGSCLDNARCSGANFINADLSGVSARGAHFDDRDFLTKVIDRKTNLDAANLSGANLDGATFEGASAKEANFSSASANGVDFRRANLQGCNFDGASTRGARFETDI